MRRWLWVTAAVVGLLPAMLTAGGFSKTYAIGNGTVAVSNNQANSSWYPISVMVRYDSPGSGTASVRRVSQAYEYVLASCTFSNVTSIVWVPGVAYSFGYGDVLVIESSVTNGVVQVLRKGD